MARTRSLAHARLVALTMALVLAGGACGGGTSDSSSESTAGGSGRTVSFQAVTTNVSMAPIQRALQAGYFEEEGVKVEFAPPDTNSAQVAVRAARGEVDFAAVGGIGPLAALSGGVDDIVVVAQTVSIAGSVTSVVLRNEVVEQLEAAGVTPDSPLVDRVEALEGLTLGVAQAGSTSQILFRGLVQAAGLDPDADMVLQQIADPAAMVAATREGRLDGFFFPAPNSMVAVSEGFAQQWITYGEGSDAELEAYANAPAIVIATSRQLVSDDPELVTSVLTAIQRGLDDVIADEDGTSEALQEEYFPDLDPAVFDLAWDAMVSFQREGSGLVIDEDGFDSAVELFNADSEAPQQFEFSDYFARRPLETIDD